MKSITFISTFFDSPVHTNRAPYNEQLMLRLKSKFDINIIRPISWVELFSSSRRLTVGHDAPTRWNGVNIAFPTYFFVPRYLLGYRGAMFLASISKTFRRQNSVPDVFFSSWAFPDSYAAMKLAQKHKRPLVMSVLGSDINILTQDVAARQKIVEVLSFASAIFSPSEALKKLVVELGIDESKVHVVYSGIDDSLFYPMDKKECETLLGLEPSKKRLLYVGNFKVAKGVMDFIYAVEKLASRVDGFEALIVGRGEEESRMRAYIDSKNLKHVIKVVGEVDHDKLGQWMNASDCLCLPSYNEGLPNVVLEALKCEINVVATNVGGIPEAVANPEAHLVEPGCVDDLSAVLQSALMEPDFETVPGFHIPSYEDMAMTVGRHILEVCQP